jgi:hypothetical protein
MKRFYQLLLKKSVESFEYLHQIYFKFEAKNQIVSFMLKRKKRNLVWKEKDFFLPLKLEFVESVSKKFI